MTQLEPRLEFLPGVTLIRRLGRGGMGEVWVARDATRGEEVVAKVLPADAPEERVALLRREARLVRKVEHPGIVPVYGFAQGPHGSAVLQRFMPGGDADRLRGAKPVEVIRVGREVAEALAHLHRLGVIHRDVKATNVLLDASGRAHVADFGIAAVADAALGGEEGLILHGGGSRASMSPQQRAGEPAQPGDDVYALGALLHELLSGRPLFPPGTTDEEMERGAPPLEPAREVPERLRTLVDSMLASAPSDRPRDMIEVAESLRALEEELAPAVAPPPPVRLQPPPRVPEVGVVAAPPVPAPSKPDPIRPARRTMSPVRAPSSPAASGPGSRTQAVLFGALGLAVLFVVLVLPRWVRSPEQSGALDEAADVAASDEAPEPTPEPLPDAPRRLAEAMPTPEPVLPAEATPTPAASSTPRERPPSTRARPVTSEPPAATAPAPPPGEEEFVAAMSEAQSALERQDWTSARSALGRAAALRPNSSSVADLRRRVEEGERLAALAQQREKARGFEAEEDWRRALAEYEAALKLDPAVTFALEGRARTKKRSELAERLDFHIAHPLRLATDSVAREAERLLQEAREVSSPGPRHRRQIADLEKALATARTPVAVILESDGETEVVVHKVGRLGAFTEKRLDLRPGTYTVIGTRRGYRDVRRQLVVEPASTPPPLVVRCEEEI